MHTPAMPTAVCGCNAMHASATAGGRCVLCHGARAASEMPLCYAHECFSLRLLHCRTPTRRLSSPCLRLSVRLSCYARNPPQPAAAKFVLWFRLNAHHCERCVQFSEPMLQRKKLEPSHPCLPVKCPKDRSDMPIGGPWSLLRCRPEVLNHCSSYA